MNAPVLELSQLPRPSGMDDAEWRLRIELAARSVVSGEVAEHWRTC